MTTPMSVSGLNPQIECVIEEMISHLEADKFMFQTDTVSNETRMRYEIMASKNLEAIMEMGRAMTFHYYVRNILKDIFDGIGKINESISQMAMSLSKTKVKLWFELPKENDELEDMLYLVEARINAKYEKSGYSMSIIIVETEDKISVPSNYKHIPLSSENLN